MSKPHTSYTQLTLRHLRKHGWSPATVEKWNPHVGIRQDLFGFADILAVKPTESGGGVLAIQSTSAGGHNEHLVKLHREPRLWDWLRAGAKAELWSWSKNKHTGQWALRRHVFDLATMPAQPPPKPRKPRKAKAAAVPPAIESVSLFANAGGAQ